jgi:hypothetical protein
MLFDMSIEQIGILTGIVATIATGCYFLYKEYKKKQLVYRRRFVGEFTNEGDITLSRPPFVNIVLTVDEDFGTLNGELQCPKIENTLNNPCIVTGKVKWNKTKIKIEQHHRGFHLIGKASLKLRQRKIEWTLIKGDSEQLPLKVILWRVEPLPVDATPLFEFKM